MGLLTRIAKRIVDWLEIGDSATEERPPVPTPSLRQEKVIPFTLDEEQKTQLEHFDNYVANMPLHYIGSKEKSVVKQRWAALYRATNSKHIARTYELYDQIRQFLGNYQHLDDLIASSNKEFIRNEIHRCEALLSDIDGKSLDEQQRTVVVTDDDRNLAIAGAGCGKTLTIAAKVKYLCDMKDVAPEDILLIAFTRKSAQEMTERIHGKLGLPVQATTFHKLGLDIIAKAEGKRPDVLDDLQEFVSDYFEKEIVNDQKTAQRLLTFFAYYIHTPADMDNFTSLGAAYAYEKAADMETLRSRYAQAQYVKTAASERGAERQTLKNERVKSLEEVQIANFLFLHGVNYEYERQYPFETGDEQHRSYHPDFYLPDYDIYIEHFGVNRDGKLPWLSPIEEKKYIEGMVWKRSVHKEHGTTLLETYSYLSSEGTLLTTLKELLLKNGVVFHQPDFMDIFNSVYETQSNKYFSEFIKLCCSFITLYKAGGYREEDMKVSRVIGLGWQQNTDVQRTKLFLSIVMVVLKRHNEHLQEKHAIDFADMINKATGYVNSGREIHPYRWVIVDEYQDISMSRYRLVNAILSKTGAKLLCVGDDWQSIYRFAGSDIALFISFEHFFGPSAIMRIEKTYRNSQQLIDAAGEFIERSPGQIRKSLRSPKSLNYPIAFMYYSESPESRLKLAMDKIIKEFGAESSILLLGRTGFDKKIAIDSGLFREKKEDTLEYVDSPDTPVTFLTVHRSKGLEADNVILLNFENSTLGFPNKIADDPVLSLVLVQGEEYPYAEERRLLYVALTRTRNRVFVLTNRERPSEFASDFKASRSVFFLNRETTEDGEKKVLCPRCKTGWLIAHRFENGKKPFVGCSNYPQCDYTLSYMSVLTDPVICPSCGGFLIKRRGKTGVFWGCANYPLCSYTKSTEESPGEGRVGF